MRFGDFLDRDESIFLNDVGKKELELAEEIKKSKFLIIGAAGTIGQAVTREIFSREPKKLDVVDINENNLVELVRDLRSSIGYISGEFDTFTLPIESDEFEILLQDRGPYDYVLNLSALKHVRNEKDPYTLSRMIDVNIFNTLKSLRLSQKMGAKKYFCVSTDKAANPTNLMGATKRIMEDFLQFEESATLVSSARFANVAFSDGSLLYGFQERFDKGQPLSAPNEIKRYFVTPKEAGELCLLSCIFGSHREIFFPKFYPEEDLISFTSLAARFLESKGYKPIIMGSEEEARTFQREITGSKEWPCFFFDSDTTGEKIAEEFYTMDEDVNLNRFDKIGIVQMKKVLNNKTLAEFMNQMYTMKKSKLLMRDEIKNLIYKLVPELSHKETGKFLNERM